MFSLAATHPGSRLVQQDDARVAGDGDADFQCALLGVREHALDAVGTVILRTFTLLLLGTVFVYQFILMSLSFT